MRVKGFVKALVLVGFGFDVALGSALLPRQAKKGDPTTAVEVPSTVAAAAPAPPSKTDKAAAATSTAQLAPSSPAQAPSPTDAGPAPSLPPLTSTLVTSAQSGSTAKGDAKSTGNSTSEEPNPTSSDDSGNTSVPVPTGFFQGNTTVPIDPNGLPFTPVISPAMAVAGVLFLLTGVPYTLAGYKYKTIHIFLSTCYLTVLSVAVLIVYVMNPPVSNGLQGGYLVACTFTGLLLGGLAMVFPEILESMTCVLGGFCLSMWFLTLKPDGLISSVIGKVVFILCITLLMWSVAFLSILKRGGMIFCISFSGATVVVLGIDCFTRAGMKEFWLYIWALNDNIFPVGRDKSFPHTRGIRVEIAAIIIITLVGMISQFKLWRLIKERREEWRESKKKRPLSRRETGNERSVEPKEESSSRDQVRWEDARYSRMPSTAEIDQIHSGAPSRRNSRRPLSDAAISRDSGIGSEDPRKSSMRDVSSVNRSSRNVSIPMLELDIGDRQPRQPSPAPSSRRKRNSNREDGTEAGDTRSSLAPGSTVVAIDTNTLSSGQQHTIIIPKDDDQSDRSSVATAAASTPASQRNSRHLSVQSLGDIMKNKMTTRHEDDNSSLAATMDQDESSEDNLPLVGSEPGSPRSNRASMLSIGGHSKRASIAESLKRSLSGRRNSTNKRDSFSRSNSTRKASKEEKSDFLKPSDIALPSSPSLDSPSSAFHEPERKSTADSSMHVERPGSNNRPDSRSVNRPVAPLKQESLQDVRPPSRLVKTFRVNEWAKHLEDAEAPEIEAIDYMDLSSSPVLGGNERVAPVNFAELQQGISAPHIPAPAPVLSRSASRVSVDTRQLSTTPIPLSPTMPRSPTSPISPTSPAIPASLLVPASSLPPQNLRQNSMSPPPLAHRTSLRSSSTPMIAEAITESPLTDLRSSWRDMSSSPIPVYSGETLLNKRESMLRSTPNLLSSREPIAVPTYAMHSSSTTSLPKRASSGARRSFADDEISRRNMPMQHSTMRPVTAQGNSPKLSSTGFPSRPNTRQGMVERERQKQMLQQWRDSMHHENIVGQHTQNAVEDRRAEMITERHMAAQYEKQREIAAIYRDSYREDQMKQRDMQELHRQALRKMQAGAKIAKP